jgi:hypothetical protein
VSAGGPTISSAGYTELDMAPVAASLKTSSAAQLRSLQRRQGSVTAPIAFPRGGIIAPPSCATSR